MINGLKSDKRICPGLLFPAYFNHVLMKRIVLSMHFIFYPPHVCLLVQ